MSSGKTVHEFFGRVMDRMLGDEPVAAPEPRMQNLATKRMHIRAVGVREGFAAMRARSDAMAERLAAFERQRNGVAEPSAATDEDETIELRSER